ncbi:MAG: DUF4236 domain-containing protein [bacterium]|nr:DUF4236 domain-containing protein [bacterium]
MRFQRRIKIAPGLRLNLSGSGIGFSAGPRGMSFQRGSARPVLTVGLPGTGISHASKIGSQSRSSQRASSERVTISFQVSMQKTGEPLILDMGDNQITDDSLVRKITRSDEYKNAVRDLSIRLKEETDEQTSEVVNLFRTAPKIQSESSWVIALSELKPEVYDAKPYDEPHPTEDDIRTELSFEAVQKIRSWKFWQLKRLRREYVNANTRRDTLNG